MGMGRLFLAAIVLVFSVTSIASPFCADSNYWRPDLKNDFVKNLVETDVTQELQFDHLKILVWNIYKASKPGVYADLDILTQDVDLALFQEGYLTKTFQSFVCSRQEYNWKMAKSFKDMSGIDTGVITVSKQNPDEFFALKSPNTEPVTNTPKMAMVTKYRIPESNRPLLVINIHGINFVPFLHYKNQIDQVVREIKKHNGPVILAGDFNTHLAERLTYIKEVLTPLGLEQAVVTGNEFNEVFVLDHLFYRDFKVVQAKALSNVTTSDHKPLYFELRLLK